MKAFAGFRAYRDLGPRRSLPRATKLHYGTPEDDPTPSGKLRQMEGWSSRWSWPARATAWDDKLDAEARQAEIDAVRAMRARHAQLGQTMAHRVLLRLVGGTANVGGQQIQVDALDPSKLGAAALARLAEAAVRIERLARGEPDTVVGEGTASGEGATGQDQDLARRILEDPELSDLASRLASALTKPADQEVTVGV